VQFEDLNVDVVNLRTESYSNVSRIPSIDVGNPIEDAHRRDLTINSMFYNIHTKKVEDNTNLGLRDLFHGIIRTPLPPLMTFTDDPLRALRAIRFACRFNFNITPELLQACKEPVVANAFRQKVSRERVYLEIELMIQTEHFDRAVWLMRETSLWHDMFSVPNALYTSRVDNHSCFVSTSTMSSNYDMLPPLSQRFQRAESSCADENALFILLGYRFRERFGLDISDMKNNDSSIEQRREFRLLMLIIF
jgi:tRNA nucleotidyltransferase (CCA-adding enzyme)